MSKHFFTRVNLNYGLLIAMTALLHSPSTALAQTPLKTHLQKPKLVLVVVVDQCRSDTLTRFHSRFKATHGLKMLMEKGAYYPNATYDMLQSMTCPGHATILSGAYPYAMGIPLNEWYDNRAQTSVYCAEDHQSPIVGLENTKPEDGMSPRRLRGSTVGDELKLAGYKSRVIGIALKDRSAIMLGGHQADMAIWYEEGRWVTSKYYAESLPSWVKSLNSELAAQPKVFKWTVPGQPTGLSPAGKVTREVSVQDKSAIATPYGTHLTTQAAIRALRELKLGQGSHPDLLAVSYSSHDMLGHQKGPNSLEMEEFSAHEDQSLGELLKEVDQRVGLANTLVVFTGDHGVAPAVSEAKAMKMPAGSINGKKLLENLNQELVKKLGKSREGDWILRIRSLNVYPNLKAISSQKLSRAEIEAEIQSAIRRIQTEGLAHVVTRTEILRGEVPAGRYGEQLRRSFVEGQSGDVIMIPEAFWVDEGAYATHMSGYNYDREVPLILMGSRFKPGVYGQAARVIDIAPTLTHVLGTVSPSGSDGRVLHESLK